MTRILRLPGPNARGSSNASRDTRFRCVVTDCRRKVGLLPNGYYHPCCPHHGALLSWQLREAIVLGADLSVFDPEAVLAAALVINKIRKFFLGQAPKKAKRTA